MAQPPEDSPFLSRWSRRKLLVRQGVVPAEPVRVDKPAQPDGQQPPPGATKLAVAPALPSGTPQALAPAQAGQAVPAEPAPVPPAPAAVQAPPAPTLADVAQLGLDGDYTRFVAPGVDSGVRNAALKKLFTNPHFNLMDGLDTYIDDYGKPDPLPPGMLRQLAQSQSLGLFADDPPATAPSAAAVPADDMLADHPLANDALADAPAEDPAHTDPADPAAALAAPASPSLAQAPSDEDAALRLQSNDAAGPASAAEGAVPDTGRRC